MSWRKDGHCYIVDIKAVRFRDGAVDGLDRCNAMAIRQKLKHEIIFAAGEGVVVNQFAPDTVLAQFPLEKRTKGSWRNMPPQNMSRSLHRHLIGLSAKLRKA
jgi:hypothetical protein